MTKKQTTPYKPYVYCPLPLLNSALTLDPDQLLPVYFGKAPASVDYETIGGVLVLPVSPDMPATRYFDQQGKTSAQRLWHYGFWTIEEVKNYFEKNKDDAVCYALKTSEKTFDLKKLMPAFPEGALCATQNIEKALQEDGHFFFKDSSKNLYHYHASQGAPAVTPWQPRDEAEAKEAEALYKNYGIWESKASSRTILAGDEGFSMHGSIMPAETKVSDKNESSAQREEKLPGFKPSVEEEAQPVGWSVVQQCIIA